MPSRLSKSDKEFREALSAANPEIKIPRSLKFTSVGVHVTLVCSKHGDFTRQIRSHLQGIGCRDCHKETKIKKIPSAIKKEMHALEKKGFDLSESMYVDARTRMSFNCSKHGIVTTLPQYLNRGCTACNNSSRLNPHKDEFFKNLTILEKNGIDTSEALSNLSVFYANSRAKIKLNCPKHGAFVLSARKIESGCLQCRVERSDSVSALKYSIKDAIKRFKDLGIDVSLAKFESVRKKIHFICPKHGDFFKKPRYLGLGCPACISLKTGKGYSEISINWIEAVAYSRRWKNVMHAANTGEMKLPGVGRVDGYHAASNTVLEFHGDCFHGNPTRYKPRSKPNPYSDLTAAQLHKKTLARDAKIRKLGYNLITIWESDWKSSL